MKERADRNQPAHLQPADIASASCYSLASGRPASRRPPHWGNLAGAARMLLKPFRIVNGNNSAENLPDLQRKNAGGATTPADAPNGGHESAPGNKKTEKGGACEPHPQVRLPIRHSRKLGSPDFLDSARSTSNSATQSLCSSGSTIICWTRHVRLSSAGIT